MKHLFKKKPPRSNEIPPTSPSPSPTSGGASAASCSSEHRATSSASAAPPSPVDSGPGPTPAAGVGGGDQNREDYYSHEEEFQIQLAMALSASNADFGGLDPDGDQIRKATLLSLGRDRIDQDREEGTAESLSRRYWDYNVIDYHEKVLDGFCDIFGLSPESSKQGKMPSLADLQSSIGDLGFEVIVVNHTIDATLVELEQIAQCFRLDCPANETTLLVQRIAELVIDNMGGPVKDANDMLARWMVCSTELRTSLQTSLLPIGCIKIGLLRHRALLFKILADKVGVKCKLVKGSHYTGVDDDAVSIIKLDDGREYLVDLMAAPGTLIPADYPSLKGTTSNTNPNPRIISSATDNPSGEFFRPDPSNQFSEEISISNQPVTTPPQIFSTAASTAGTSSSGAIPLDWPQNLNQFPIIGSTSSELFNESVNPLPDTQEIDDTRKLFADLNPFGKVAPDSRVNTGGYQRRRENVSPGPSRPQQPLVVKNWSAYNEEPFQRRNKNVNDNAASSSSQRPPMIGKSPYVNNKERYSNNSDHSFLGNKIDMQVASVQPPPALKGHLENLNGIHDMNKGPNDRFMGDLIEKKTVESAMSLSQTRPSRLDPMLDDVSECEILWEDLVIGERIGLGSYGEVYRADWSGKEVAVKKFLDQEFYGDALDEFRSEVRIMRRLRHPNVVLFMGAVTRPPHLSIVSEFLPRGSLYRLLHRPNCQIDEKRRIRMALDVAKGMNCLHTSVPTIVHRDLKSPNLLVDKNWTVKVCDFGLSRLKHSTFLSSKSTAGTPEWMAPEVLRNEPSNEKCDVYSFGVILWELATLRMPWSGMNPMQVVGAVGFQDRRLDIPKDVDPLVSTIISQCWQTDPSLRPSFAHLTTALKSLQRLVIQSSLQDTQSPPVPQEIFVNSSTP
ncbi:protein kinase family protein [Rhynchospora pubera]|uniref:non-specific serine/threonine protein kinase n=1 Tax=Rhynchospora pubera TaxID=906938 RepID=A0AAV8DNM7_9POAL|nr:protein kinase family protein [Rhynchospora pubera]